MKNQAARRSTVSWGSTSWFMEGGSNLFAESLPSEGGDESLGSLIQTPTPFWGLFVHNLIPSQRSYLQYSNTLILERHKSSIWSTLTGQRWTHFPAQKSSEVPLLVNKLHLVSYDRSTHIHTQKSLSRVRLFATPWIVAHQALPSMGFSRHEYWSGLPFPSPGDLPDPEIEPGSPAWKADALTSEPPGKMQFR